MAGWPDGNTTLMVAIHPEMRAGTGSQAPVREAVRTGLRWQVHVYLFCTLMPMGMSLGPVVMTSQRLLLLMLIIPTMIGIFSGRYGKLILADLLFPLHILWILIALYANNPDRAIEQTGSVGLEFLGGYAIGRAYIRTPSDFTAFCRTIVVVILIMLPFAVFETLTGRALILETFRKIPGVFSSGLANSSPRLGLERVQLTLPHPIHFGLFCSTVVPLVIVGLKDVVSDARRFLYAGIAILCGFLSLSSGAFLAVALQLGLIIWAFLFRHNPKRWRILIWLGVAAYIVVDLLSNRSPYQVFLSYATFNAHTAYWRNIILDWGISNVIGSAERGIPGSPWVGLGFNDWIRPSFMHSGSMDNFWLVMAVRYGLPGFLLLAVGYLAGILKIMLRDFTADPALARIRLAWVFLFLGTTFTLSTVHVWLSLYSYIFFLFGAGMWMVHATPRDAEGAVTDEDEAAPAGPASRFTRFRSGSAQGRFARG